MPTPFKKLSRRLSYDPALDTKIPAELRFFPSADHEYPVFMEPHLLSPLACDALVDNMLTNGHRKPATVGSGEGIINKELRETDFLRPNLPFQAMYVTALRELMPRVEAFFGAKLIETPETQAYGYPPGGHYVLHADNAVQERDARGEVIGWRADRPYRSITAIAYLTDSVPNLDGYNHCVGGLLSFPFLVDDSGKAFEIVPSKGLFVAFPSNPYFAHQVHPIEAGYRVAIVSWFSRGQPPAR